MVSKDCSSCKTSNPISANFCRQCGLRFPEHTKPRKSHMCHIENFSVKKQANGKFLVEWNAINAEKVTLNGGDVTGNNKSVVTVKGSYNITLRADNATSFDVKEFNVIYESQTIYKDKIVEKKVTSGVNVAVLFLIAFIILSAFSIYYAYRLEDRNYSGPRHISNILGYKPYLLINGDNKDRTITVPPQGASIMHDIQTNASEYEIIDLPDWCGIDKRTSHFVIKATKNRLKNRTASIKVKTVDDYVTIHLEQDIYKPQRLLVNDKKTVDSHLSATSGQVTFQVNTDAVDYEIISLSSWFKVVSKSIDSFTISYEENPKLTERKDWFKIKSEGMEVKINLMQSAQRITGEIENITLEHNVYENDIKGMKIHLKFSIQRMKGIKGRCVAYFYYEDGTPVKDKNSSYRTADDQAAWGKDFTPSYDNSTFNDLVIFMPYKELEAEKGEHAMKLSCTVWEYSSGNAASIARSDYYSFTLTK